MMGQLQWFVFKQLIIDEGLLNIVCCRGGSKFI